MCIARFTFKSSYSWIALENPKKDPIQMISFQYTYTTCTYESIHVYICSSVWRCEEAFAIRSDGDDDDEDSEQASNPIRQYPV